MKSILVIEDNILLSDFIAEVLQEEGYNVQVAANGQEGLSRLHEVEPDLVITQGQNNRGSRGIGMAMHVGQALLHNAKQAQLDGLRKPAHLLGNLETHFDAAALGKSGNIPRKNAH